LADPGARLTAAGLDPLRGELEKILEQGFSGNTAKTGTRGFGVGVRIPVMLTNQSSNVTN
jgi:hypothetical protein